MEGRAVTRKSFMGSFSQLHVEIKSQGIWSERRPGGVLKWDTGFEEVPRVFKALLSLHWVTLWGCPIDGILTYGMLSGFGLMEIAESLGESPILLRGSAPASAISGWKDCN